MKIEIVILNYNGAELLEKCLPSVLKAAAFSQYTPKVYVLDNVSVDSSERLVKEKFPEVIFWKARENKVLCSYNDFAFRSEADILVFLNNDLVVDEGFIDPLIGVFEKRDDVFLSAARVYNLDGTEIEEGRCKPVLKLGMFKALGRFEGFETDIDSELPTFQAGFGAFDRKKFLELGGYDSIYLPGIMEDSDLCLRAWKKGFVSIYQPKSHIFHIGKASFNKRFGNRKRLAISHRNTYIFVWKNFDSKRSLLSNFFFTPLRLLYALFTGKPEIIWGYFWFIARLGHVAKARQAERAKTYNLTTRKVFEIFRGIRPVRIEKLIGERFDILADTFPDRIDETDLRLQAIIAALGDVRGKRILEVGCGKGRISRILKARGADIYGIDISEKLLEHARTIAPDHFFKAEAYSIPFKSNTFDALVLLEVIEHIPQLERAIKEMARVLTPEGRLVIVDRNKFSLNNRRFLVPNLIIKRYHELKNEWMYPRDFPYREIWFNPARVRELLSRYFDVSEYSYILSGGEIIKAWHAIFRLIPQIRYFTLWRGQYKRRVKEARGSRRARLKVFGDAAPRVEEVVAVRSSVHAIEGRPNPIAGSFCLRIDADEYTQDSFRPYLKLFEKYHNAVSIFFCIDSFKDAPSEITRCKALGLEVASHGFYHYTYSDYKSNRFNIHKARVFLGELGIDTFGFVAPTGRWNPQLTAALADEGYKYSSDFSYDYLSVPGFACADGAKKRILQIPVFPVAPELFYRKDYPTEEVFRYYTQAIDEMIRCNLQVVIYAHTSREYPQVPGLLARLLDHALSTRGLKPMQMRDMYHCWIAHMDEPAGAPVRVPRQEFLGHWENGLLFRHMKNSVKRALDIESLTPREELCCSNAKKRFKILARKILGSPISKSH